MSRYNGWTNYETWAVALWIDNERGSHEYWREVARGCWEGARADGMFSRQDRARFALADRLKDELVEASPLNDDSSLYSDLLNAAISEVNWSEIACSMLTELVAEENP